MSSFMGNVCVFLFSVYTYTYIPTLTNKHLSHTTTVYSHQLITNPVPYRYNYGR